MTSHDLVAAVARNRLKQALPAVLLLGLSACAGTSTGVVTRYPGGSVSEPSATASTSSAATTSHAAGSSAASAEAALARGDAAGAARAYQAAAIDAAPEQAADLRLRADRHAVVEASPEEVETSHVIPRAASAALALRCSAHDRNVARRGTHCKRFLKHKCSTEKRHK